MFSQHPSWRNCCPAAGARACMVRRTAAAVQQPAGPAAAFGARARAARACSVQQGGVGREQGGTGGRGSGRGSSEGKSRARLKAWVKVLSGYSRGSGGGSFEGVSRDVLRGMGVKYVWMLGCLEPWMKLLRRCSRSKNSGGSGSGPPKVCERKGGNTRVWW
eukprot:1156035-Pelagomonas_calceolata.AAC.6